MRNHYIGNRKRARSHTMAHGWLSDADIKAMEECEKSLKVIRPKTINPKHL